MPVPRLCKEVAAHCKPDDIHCCVDSNNMPETITLSAPKQPPFENLLFYVLLFTLCASLASALYYIYKEKEPATKEKEPATKEKEPTTNTSSKAGKLKAF